MISRRTFLAGSASLALLAACGGGASPTGDTEDNTPKILGAGFADGYAANTVLVAGIAQRAPLVVMNSVGRPIRGDAAPASIDVEVFHKGSNVSKQTVARHADGIPTPYYPLLFTPAEPGDYEARSPFSQRAMPFRVAAREGVALVQVGERLRSVNTPTTADSRGVTPICTRTPDPCPFHSISLADAITAGKPIAFIISTPGFCQTAICGPVLELLIEASKSRGVMQFVHAEVYVEPNKKTSGSPKTTEAVNTYGLDYEPTMFIADASGTVTARLDFSWDRAELAAALATIP